MAKTAHMITRFGNMLLFDDSDVEPEGTASSSNQPMIMDALQPSAKSVSPAIAVNFLGKCESRVGWTKLNKTMLLENSLKKFKETSEEFKKKQENLLSETLKKMDIQFLMIILRN